MWIFTENGYLSIVADPSSAKRVIVRAHREEHIDHFLPNAKVFMISNSEMSESLFGPDDYRYQATIGRDELNAAIANLTEQVKIGTFRGRIADPLFYDICNKIRRVLFRLNKSIPQRFFNDEDLH